MYSCRSLHALARNGTQDNKVARPWPSIDDSVKGTKIEEWGARQVESCAKIGMDPRASQHYKQWMIDAGFENVKEIQ